MFATRRTQVLRTTLGVAAMAAALIASNAHAGLLGGGAGGGLTSGLTSGLTGGLNGALSPRQLDIVGRANGSANADGALIKGTVDKTKGAVGGVKDSATGKVSDAKTAVQGQVDTAKSTVGDLKTTGQGAADSLASTTGSLGGSADGSANGALNRGDTPAAATPSTLTPTPACAGQGGGIPHAGPDCCAAERCGDTTGCTASSHDSAGNASGQSDGRNAHASGSTGP